MDRNTTIITRFIELKYEALWAFNWWLDEKSCKLYRWLVKKENQRPMCD